LCPLGLSIAGLRRKGQGSNLQALAGRPVSNRLPSPTVG